MIDLEFKTDLDEVRLQTKTMAHEIYSPINVRQNNEREIRQYIETKGTRQKVNTRVEKAR